MPEQPEQEEPLESSSNPHCYPPFHAHERVLALSLGLGSSGICSSALRECVGIRAYGCMSV